MVKKKCSFSCAGKQLSAGHNVASLLFKIANSDTHNASSEFSTTTLLQIHNKCAVLYVKKSLTLGSELHIPYPCNNNTMSSPLFSTSHSLFYKASLGRPWHMYPIPDFKPPCCTHNQTASTEVCILLAFSVLNQILSFFVHLFFPVLKFFKTLLTASFSQTLQSVPVIQGRWHILPTERCTTRPHLEWQVQFWPPQQKGNMDIWREPQRPQG